MVGSLLSPADGEAAMVEEKFFCSVSLSLESSSEGVVEEVWPFLQQLTCHLISDKHNMPVSMKLLP